tara:strand:- start:458 stop:961 length:504 start_codon:yes stop_codon:yes gene_type:complete
MTLVGTHKFNYLSNGQHLSVPRPGIIFDGLDNKHEKREVIGNKMIIINNAPEWADPLSPPPFPDERYTTLEAMSRETWKKEIGWGLEGYALMDTWGTRNYRPDSALMRTRRKQLRDRLHREIELLGPTGMKWFISDHKSLAKYPYRNLVKGYMGVTPERCGGGGGKQ